MAQGESFVYTACPGWGDHDYCAIKTIVKDGRIVRTEPVKYTGPEVVDGHICQKGCLAARQPYDPERLKKPLKRIGERGEGKWEEISWDQALDEIGDKLNSIIERYGAESIVMWSLVAGVPPQFGASYAMACRFANYVGVTNPINSISLDTGPYYSEFYAVGGISSAHTLHDPRTIIGSDLILIWGSNPIENQMRGAQNLVRAREAGAKIITIGLIFDGSAGFADEFYGVKPGSDGELAMGMINYVVNNDLYDAEYLIRRTNAAYLVRDDNGLLARDADGNFLVFDNDAQAITTVAPARGAYSSSNLALLGHYEMEGIGGVTPAFQILKDRAAKWTPAYTAEQTGLTPDEVVKLAHEYGSAEKAYILSGYGLRYRNCNETYRLQDLLGFVTGRHGRPGSGVFEALQLQGYPIVFNDLAVTCPEGNPALARTVAVRCADWFEAAQKPDSKYKAFLVSAGNPVHQQPNRDRWLKIFENMELVVDYDVWMTDTGEISDYVLPDCMPFEREDLIASACYNHIMLQEPAIEPPEGCDPRDPVFYWSELAKRLGYGEHFQKTSAEWIDIRLDTQDPSIKYLEPKVTYERLKKEKMIRTLAPEAPWDPYANEDEVMGNATGRIEIYAERLVDFDLQVASPLPVGVIGTDDAYPYQLFTGRQRFFMQSSFTHDPVTIALSGHEPATRLNPADAKREGLRSGDKVEVYNDLGHVVTRLDIDESVPPGTVHVWFGWRREQFEEGTYAEMVHPFSNRESTGALEDKWWNDWVAAGNIPNSFVQYMAGLTGSTDNYWDSICNIRKYEKEA